VVLVRVLKWLPTARHEHHLALACTKGFIMVCAAGSACDEVSGKIFGREQCIFHRFIDNSHGWSDRYSRSRTTARAGRLSMKGEFIPFNVP
jgi:hypothetical protein